MDKCTTYSMFFFVRTEKNDSGEFSPNYRRFSRTLEILFARKKTYSKFGKGDDIWHISNVEDIQYFTLSNTSCEFISFLFQLVHYLQF